MIRSAALPFERLCASIVYVLAVIVIAFAHGQMSPATASPLAGVGGLASSAFLCLPGETGDGNDAAGFPVPCEACLLKAGHALPPDAPRLRPPVERVEQPQRTVAQRVVSAAPRAHRARAPPAPALG